MRTNLAALPGQFAGSRYRTRSQRLAANLLALILVAAIVYPLVEVFAEPTSELARVWDKATSIPRISQTYINTVLIGVGCVFVAAPLGIILGWCTALLSERMQRIATALCVLPILLPSLASVIGWVFVFSPAIGYGNVVLRATPFFSGEAGPVRISSLGGVIILTGLHLVPYVYLFVLTALRNVDGRIEDAARVSGASWFGAQARAVFPSIRPSVVYGVVIILLLSLGQFTTVLILGRDSGIDVITTEMYRQTVSYPVDYPLAAFLGLPLLIIALVLVGFQRRCIGDISRYAPTSKGAGMRRRGHPLFIIPIAGFSALAIIPPVAGLCLVAFSPFWSRNINWAGLTTRHFRQAFEDDRFISSLYNTVKFSLLGTIGALVVAVLIALFLTRSASRLRALVDYVINLPLALPGSIVGMGIFLSFALGPLSLYGSGWLFVIAFIILYIPHGVRMAIGGMSQHGNEVVSAGRTSGAGALKTLLLVQLPLLRKSLAAGGMLYFTLMSHEFSAASMVRTGSDEVLSTQLYSTFADGTFPKVAVIALVMSAVSSVGVVLMLVSGGLSSFEKV